MLNGETGFTDLLEVRCGETGKLCSHVVDDVEVAVRPIVITESEISADSLCIRSIHLNHAAESQQSRKGIAHLQAGQIDREVPYRQSKSIQLWQSGKGEFCPGR